MWFWFILIGIAIIFFASLLGESYMENDIGERYAGIAGVSIFIIIFIIYGVFMIINIFF